MTPLRIFFPKRLAAVLRDARLLVWAGLAMSCAALSGCGSISEALSERAAEAPAIGLPANAPARPASQMVYPAVHDMPPARPAALMNENEQQKVERELAAARSRHQSVNDEAVADEPKKKPAAAR